MSDGDEVGGLLAASHTSRALRLLSQASRALWRAEDELSVLGEVCRIAVEEGGYRLAWVGLTVKGKAAALPPAAYAGEGPKSIEELLCPGHPESGTSPAVAAAIASGRPCVARHGAGAPVALRADAIGWGCRCSVALPLSVELELVGVLELFSADEHAFDASELEVLAQLARDVAMGLTALRARAERDRVLAELRTSHRQLRTLIDSLPDFVARFDALGRYTFVSGSLTRAIPVGLQDVLGRTPIELRVCEDPAEDQALVASIARVFASGQPEMLEVSFRTPGGAKPFEVRHIPEHDGGAIVSVLGIARDLGTQRAAARQLYLLNFALDNVGEGIYLMHGDSPLFEYVNQGAAQSLGYTREELTSGMGVLDVDAALDEAQWREVFQAVQQARRLRVETLHRHRDGRILPVEVTGNVFEFEGESYNLAIVRDISERKAAEAAQRALEAQLRQAQKMEAVGQLAGGIAHDFNNVMAVVQMVSSLLLETDEIGRDTRDGLQEIMAATDRAANLTRQLLTFSRRRAAELVEIDLVAIVHEMSKLLRRVLGEHIVLDTSLPPGPVLVQGDAGMLEQVLMNLAINGRDAMPNGGRLVILLERTRWEKSPAGAPGVTGGPCVCLSVSDTGHGISDQDLAKLFEPFFTTKEPGKGTGLGLATVFGIVQQHQGFIDVETVVGGGSTFRVFLPAVAEDRQRVSPKQPYNAPLRGDEMILVVEDDSALRAITRSALERYGYRVLDAESPAEALRIWGEGSSEIALLLTDLIMPGRLSARQLAERLLAAKPSLKVLFTSGYSPDIVNRVLHLAPGQVLLEKPYSPATLARAVRRCLDAARPEFQPAPQAPAD